MFEKLIVFGLFEMIQKKKSEDRVPGLGLASGSGWVRRCESSHLLRGQSCLCSVLYRTFGYLLCCVPIIHC